MRAFIWELPTLLYYLKKKRKYLTGERFYLPYLSKLNLVGAKKREKSKRERTEESFRNTFPKVKQVDD